MGRNVLELFCVFLYTDYLSNLHEKFQVASTYNTNVESHISSFSCNFVLDYIGHKHTQRPTAKNAIFGFKKP